MTGVPVWLWVVYALAVARLSGLITQDKITNGIRLAVLRRLDDERAAHRAAAYLVTCPWCVSIYVAAAAAALAWWHGTRPWLAVPALALAFSQVTGMTSDLGRPSEPGQE